MLTKNFCSQNRLPQLVFYTVITDGKFPTNILKIIQGEPIGTHFEPQPEPTSARKRWISIRFITSGAIVFRMRER